MFFSAHVKTQLEQKENKLPDEFRSIFELPLMEHMSTTASEWLSESVNWEMDEMSRELFKRARDGQGFSVIVFVENDLATSKPRAKIVLFPAYNGKDGLPKEDKNGIPYNFLEYVDSSAGFGQVGVGIVHKMSIQKYLLKKELENNNSALSKGLTATMQNEGSNDLNATLLQCQEQLFTEIEDRTHYCEGFTFGLGLIKGAESKSTQDYTIQVLTTPQEGAALRRNFLSKITSAMPRYDKSKKYLIFAPSGNEDNTYEIYYILNQKIVRRPNYKEELTVPTISLDKDIINNIEQSQQQLVEHSLKALNLFQCIFITNKSASQNNASVAYDFDFESYTMYTDPKRYILNQNEKCLSPEGREAGSFYDLQRSVPLELMTPFCDVVVSCLGETKFDPQEIKMQKKNCSSWTTPSYSEVIKNFHSASPEEKLVVFANNIHITFRLFFETLRTFSTALNLASDLNDKGITANPKFFKENEHKSFKGTFVVEDGKVEVNKSIYFLYMNSLLNRLDHLLFSYNKAKELTHNTTSLMESDSLIPEWVKEIGDRRTLKTMIEDCKKLSGTIQYGVDELKKMVQHITDFNLIKTDFIKKAETCAQLLCKCDNEYSVISHFNPNKVSSMLYYLRHINISKDEIALSLQRLLRNVNEATEETALENAVRRGWYNTAEMLISYGADPTQKNKKTGDSVFAVTIKKIKSVSQQEINHLDNFLFNIINNNQWLSPDEAKTLLQNIQESVNKEGPSPTKTITLLQSKNPQLGNQFLSHSR